MNASCGLDLVEWLQALDLAQYAGRFRSNGLASPAHCLTLTDDILLRDFGIEIRAHRQTLLLGVQQFIAQYRDPDTFSEDSWESENSSGRNSVQAGTATNSGFTTPQPAQAYLSLGGDSDLPPPPPAELLFATQGISSSSQHMPPPPPPPPATSQHHPSRNRPRHSLGSAGNTRHLSSESSPAPSSPKMFNHASLVNLQHDDPEIDLDTLLADLAEIEQTSLLPPQLESYVAQQHVPPPPPLPPNNPPPPLPPNNPPSRPASRPGSSLSTMSSASSLNVKPPVVTIKSTAVNGQLTGSPPPPPPPPPPMPAPTVRAPTVRAPAPKPTPVPAPVPAPSLQQPQMTSAPSEDDFSKILADLESLTTSDLPQAPFSSATATNHAARSGQHPAPISNVGSSTSSVSPHARHNGHSTTSSSLLRQPSELDLMKQIDLLSGGMNIGNHHGHGHSHAHPMRDVKSPSVSYHSAVSPTTSPFSSSVSRAGSLASTESAFTPSSSATSTLSTPRHTSSAISPRPSISSASSASELEELNILSAHLTRELTDTTSNAPSEDFPTLHTAPATQEVPNSSIVRLPTTKDVVKVNEMLAELERELAGDANISQEEKESRLKKAKVQFAMDKLKEANKKKLVLKAYNEDGSSKMIVINEEMTAYDVTLRLVQKNRIKPTPNYVLLEHLAEHFIERRIEDHELMVPILECWGVNSPNTIHFAEMQDKYMLFKRPQLYMPPSHDYAPGSKSSIPEPKKRDLLLKDLFVAQAIPELEGNLMVKEGRKGPWKKYFFVFRKSGLYFSPKGKAVATKDLQRYTDLKDMVLYSGSSYVKKYKAPTEFCFTLKKILSVDSRRMLHFCVETIQEKNAWTTAIRVARFGNRLLENFERTTADMPWSALETEEEIDGLVRLQEKERQGMSLQRSGSIGGRLRMGTSNNGHGSATRKNEKGARQHRASTFGEMTLRSRASFRMDDHRPSSAMASGSVSDADDVDMDDGGEPLTAFQQMFGSAWKQGNKVANQEKTVELVEPDMKDVDDMSPTPMAMSPFLAAEDGMYSIRLA